MAPIWITTFLVLGAVFGLATFRIRHLLSEGPSRAPDGGEGGFGALVLWIGVSATLWPVLVLSGLYGAWRRGQRQARH